MGGEVECPCSESSELSNLTSLPSENTIFNSSDLKANPADRKQDDRTCFSANPLASVSCQANPVNFNKSEPHSCLLCQAYGLNECRIPVNCKSGFPQENQPMWHRVNWKWPRSRYFKKKDKTYEVRLKKKHCQHYPKPYMLCEISEGIPRKKSMELVSQDEDPLKRPTKEGPTEKIDIYYFDHGNSAFGECSEKFDKVLQKYFDCIYYG